tara:strand:- start:638 stop:796 length:159 start_codon:yes stop_codon:yes gene_type:complete
MNKSSIAGLTYRSKDIGDVAYSGAKRVASSSEKTQINGILSNFLSSVVSKHS